MKKFGVRSFELGVEAGLKPTPTEFGAKDFFDAQFPFYFSEL
jgi:hypothetical protein